MSTPLPIVTIHEHGRIVYEVTGGVETWFGLRGGRRSLGYFRSEAEASAWLWQHAAGGYAGVTR